MKQTFKLELNQQFLGDERPVELGAIIELVEFLNRRISDFLKCGADEMAENVVSVKGLLRLCKFST